jgi:hypothetical protein
MATQHQFAVPAEPAMCSPQLSRQAKARAMLPGLLQANSLATRPAPSEANSRAMLPPPLLPAK